MRWIAGFVAAVLCLSVLAADPFWSTPGREMHTAETEVVIARYNEADLSWIAGIGPDSRWLQRISRVTIYNKGPTPVIVPDVLRSSNVAVEVHALPNVGREGHTYLHHVLQRYSTLPDVTIFLPASVPTLAHKVQLARTVVSRTLRTGDSVFAALDRKIRSADEVRSLREVHLNEHRSTHPANASLNPEARLLPASPRPLGPWMDEFLPPGVKLRVGFHCGIFSVARRHARNHTEAHYQRLLDQVSSHSNPEAGHYLERVWEGVFHPIPDANVVASIADAEN